MIARAAHSRPARRRAFLWLVIVCAALCASATFSPLRAGDVPEGGGAGGNGSSGSGACAGSGSGSGARTGENDAAHNTNGGTNPPAGAPPLHSSLPKFVQQGTVTSVNFTAVEGTTAINPYFVGQVTKVAFVNLAHQELPDGAVKANIDQAPDAIRVTVPDAHDVGGIIVEGSAGSVGIFIRPEAMSALLSSRSVVPEQGAMMIANGGVNDTFWTAPRLVDPAAAPGANSVLLAGTPAQIVAVRADGVAIQASGIAPPATGSDRVSVRNASGVTTEAIVPAWGYNVSVQPVTTVGETVAIMLAVTGLSADDTATFRFIPQPGQHIEPLSVSVHGSQAASAVAQLSSDSVGPQAFDVAATLNAGR
jgi:hypothetical protein